MITLTDYLDAHPEAVDAFEELARKERIDIYDWYYRDLPVLVRHPDNNDVNGSQHHDYHVNFNYEDAPLSYRDRSVGYWMFAVLGDGVYSGNQYHSDTHVDAFVLDPPAYADQVYI